jgi:hypothetical protein
LRPSFARLALRGRSPLASPVSRSRNLFALGDLCRGRFCLWRRPQKPEPDGAALCGISRVAFSAGALFFREFFLLSEPGTLSWFIGPRSGPTGRSFDGHTSPPVSTGDAVLRGSSPGSELVVAELEVKSDQRAICLSDGSGGVAPRRECSYDVLLSGLLHVMTSVCRRAPAEIRICPSMYQKCVPFLIEM